ncbi:MAG: hypothetical protein HYZ54_05890 [Ignavibacteriae bacterium]|nr:hypothetical protein [Ignavibacteriota bacterium]
MSRISSYTNQVDSHYWMKANQQLIQKHPAWHEDADAWHAEALLDGKDPFTYLLRKGDKEYAYFITFVKEDRNIKHQSFTLEHDRGGWYYKNGTAYGPAEIIGKTLEELIPQMLHCEPKKCIPLSQFQT